jgi:hypothetical protein
MLTNYKQISGYKVDEVARILVSSYDAKEVALKKQMEETLIAECKKSLPSEVMEFFGKYPNKVRNQGNVTFRHNDSYFYLDLKVPTLECDVMKTIVKSGSEVYTKLTGLAVLSKANSDEKHKLQNQIKCTLTKLRTYNKIAENFPEAYDILLYKVDKVDKVTDSLCDNVEELRAKLNKK